MRRSPAKLIGFNLSINIFLFINIWLLDGVLTQSQTQDTTTVPVNVGVVLDTDSVVGKIGLSCINMALSDFYATNPHYKTRLVHNTKDSAEDVVASATADQIRRKLLTWPKRFEIVMGISRGLLDLHQDSRLRIIHSDLKASNVLLGNELNPKISDFGIAKMFGGDQLEAKTRRVVGTYGYMSPEYAIDEKFSMKSDVFSLGVLLLDIESGKRNRGFNHPDHYHNLLGHAWLLWNDGKALKLMDPCLVDSCVLAQVVRCIQVGLLCVQRHPEDRPVTSSVVLMMGNEEFTLPHPKEPGFFTERSSSDTYTLALNGTPSTENAAVTITMPEGR